MSSILLVDDNVELVENLKEILEYEGHHIVAVSGVEDGVAKLECDRFDLIITDMRMPDKDGTNLVREARVRWPEIPVVPMTAFADDGLVHQAHEYGAIGMIAKPVDIENLCRVVDVLTRSGKRVLIFEGDRHTGVNMVQLVSQLGDVVPLWVSDIMAARRVIDGKSLSAAVLGYCCSDQEEDELENRLVERFGTDFGVLYVLAEENDAAKRADEHKCNAVVLARPFEPFEFVSALRKIKA